MPSEHVCRTCVFSARVYSFNINVYILVHICDTHYFMYSYTYNIEYIHAHGLYTVCIVCTLIFHSLCWLYITIVTIRYECLYHISSISLSFSFSLPFSISLSLFLSLPIQYTICTMCSYTSCIDIYTVTSICMLVKLTQPRSHSHPQLSCRIFFFSCCMTAAWIALLMCLVWFGLLCIGLVHLYDMRTWTNGVYGCVCACSSKWYAPHVR
jgi:hypothetical protein